MLTFNSSGRAPPSPKRNTSECVTNSLNTFGPCQRKLIVLPSAAVQQLEPILSPSQVKILSCQLAGLGLIVMKEKPKRQALRAQRSQGADR
jgi:hypothetical protein